MHNGYVKTFPLKWAAETSLPTSRVAKYLEGSYCHNMTPEGL